MQNISDPKYETDLKKIKNIEQYDLFEAIKIF